MTLVEDPIPPTDASADAGSGPGETDPWATVVGQDRAVAQLRAAVDAPVHAYLLVGPAGQWQAGAWPGRSRPRCSRPSPREPTPSATVAWPWPKPIPTWW